MQAFSLQFLRSSGGSKCGKDEDSFESCAAHCFKLILPSKKRLEKLVNRVFFCYAFQQADATGKTGGSRLR
jgi:hypothetical protein